MLQKFYSFFWPEVRLFYGNSGAKILLAFVIVKRNETVVRERPGELARFSDTSSSIRIIGPWFPFLLGGYYTREDYYPSERRAEVRRERRSCAFEIHAFIQRGPSNPARQEKCYEKWMGQFSISQRLGPRTVGISFYYAYTHIYLWHVRLSRARKHERASESFHRTESVPRCRGIFRRVVAEVS